MNKKRLVIGISTFFMMSGLVIFFVTSESAASQLASTATGVLTPVNSTPLPPTLAGIVTDANGPVASAIVQIQDMSTQTQTAQDGSFTFTGITGTTPLVITAWATGHYIGWTTVNPSAPGWKGGNDLKIALNPLPTTDHSDYTGFSFEGVSGSASCGLCHREYREWQADAHAQAATDPHFISLYAGTDINGRQGQSVRWSSNGVALPPDPSQPYYGPGFRWDTPEQAGNCATCHTPLASKTPNDDNCTWSGCHNSLAAEWSNGALDPPVVPLNLQGNAAEGINCEFCHKIGDVILDPKTKLPLPDMPGILSMQLYRPADDSQQVFFGPLVDVSRPTYSYLPLLSKGEYCAGCHYGVFGGVVGAGEVTGGTVIYNSYGEWLASPYSDPKTGKSCQQCHMPLSSANWFVYPGRGGLVRNYTPLYDHRMLGASDAQLLQNSVTMKSSAQRVGNQLQVQVSITDDKTGHDVPTDSPIRSVILVVEALGSDGKPLALVQGPVNPDFSGDYGGLPGKTFAKVLMDNWTGETPTAAFWRPITVVEDTRLAPLATDTTHYVFNAPARTAVTVNVKLLYRRAFYALEKQKSWNDPDILMAYETMHVLATTP